MRGVALALLPALASCKFWSRERIERVTTPLIRCNTSSLLQTPSAAAPLLLFQKPGVKQVCAMLHAKMQERR